MKLVDDDLIPRRNLVVVFAPVETPVEDDAVSNRTRHFAGVGVDPAESLAVDDDELVLVARTGLRDHRRPVPAPLLRESVAVLRPIVERSCDVNFRGVRRPDSKRGALRTGYGSHAGRLLDFNASHWTAPALRTVQDTTLTRHGCRSVDTYYNRRFRFAFLTT